MRINIILAFVSFFVISSCKDREIDECVQEIMDTEESMSWIPNSEGDTVSILVNSKPIQFIVTQNEHHVDPSAEVFMGTICVNDWRTEFTSTEMDISTNSVNDGFTKISITISGERLHFKEYKPGSNKQLAIFEPDSLNGSIIRATLKYNKGFIEIETR